MQKWHVLTVVIGVQAGLDIMGIVTHVGPLGSVKRKSDNSELSRRDITMLDQRCVHRHNSATLRDSVAAHALYLELCAA